ncbi:trypsin-like peptidase domain-containing protein [Candidatus Sumerlaeota bacterium]|nr:trypsin-like peptidase domain-containing protein [Candidatus Sumerlaeota bacterium]
MRSARLFLGIMLVWTVSGIGLLASKTAQASSADQNLTPRTFIDLARQVRPSVVSIRINTETWEKFEQWRRDQQSRPPRSRREFVIPPGGSEEDMNEMRDWLREFFRFEMPAIPEQQRDLFRYPYGAGSGMIVRSDGYILTNRHVLYYPATGPEGKMFKEGDITVILADGRKFNHEKVKVVAADPLSDLAVLKIDASGLPAVKWGDSDKLEVGEWVMAIGDPLELRGSVSQGIISGLGRDVEIAGYPQLLQTDAMINPGNSGGPLVNLEGEVVGVNMAIASTTRLWAGVGFAIPSTLARKICDDLIEHGHPVRGYIGILMTDPDNFGALAAHEGYEGKKGVGIVEVFPGTPGEKAGLRQGDIIVRVDGKEVESNLTVVRTVTAHRPGEKMIFEIFRNGKTEKVTVTAGEWPSEEKLAALVGPKRGPQRKKAKAQVEQADKQQLGLEVETYPDKPGAAEDEKGVIIRRIIPGSRAANAQPPLQVGDVIMSVERKRVHSSNELKQRVEERLAEIEKATKKAKTLMLSVRRGDKAAMLVFVPLSESEAL